LSVPAKVNESTTLAMVIDDGATGLYPRAEIFLGATLKDTINLTDLGKGRYEGSWTPTDVGVYSALFSVFLDSGYTTELTPFIITREVEQIFVTQSNVDDLATTLARLLGLVHENAFIDNTTYDSNSMLLSGRVRIFDSKANAQLATDGGSETTGLVATYTIEADYEGPGRMKTYRMVQE
jgi:hypothetical protein